MIKNYKQYNESLRDLMVGPTKEEVWSSYIKGELKGFIDSVPESPEDFFNKMKEGCKIIKKNKRLYFTKKDRVIFYVDPKNKELYINYYLIFEILEKIFGFNDESLLRDLIKKDKDWYDFKVYLDEWI